MEIFVKTPYFRQKSKFLSKIDLFLSKIKVFLKNRKFCQTSKFPSKIESFLKNWNFGQKSEFWLKIEILVKNPKFLHNVLKVRLLPKIENHFVYLEIFGKVGILVKNRHNWLIIKIEKLRLKKTVFLVNFVFQNSSLIKKNIVIIIFQNRVVIILFFIYRVFKTRFETLFLTHVFNLKLL